MHALFPTPAAGFDSPLEVLDGCHERVRRHCALIERIAGHVPLHGADQEAREAAAGVLRYFDIAGANHHRDEEDDLFPALLASADARSRGAVVALIARLEEDHVALEALWATLRAWLTHIAAGRAEPAPEGRARRLTEAYDDHIVEEERVLFPLARRLLSQDALARLGASMASRRSQGPAA